MKSPDTTKRNKEKDVTIGEHNALLLLLPKCHGATKCLFAFISMWFAGSTLVSSLTWYYHPSSLRPEGKG